MSKRIKEIALTLTFSIFITATIIAAPLSATADSTTAVASLASQQVSINGADPIILQCYYINDHTYFRVRDITNAINMYVGGTGDYVQINSTDPADMSQTLEPITDNAPTVQLRDDGNIKYDMYGGIAQFFNWNNRNYFQLRSIDAVTQTVLNAVTQDVTDQAKAGVSAPSPTTQKTIDVGWIAETGVITINVTDHDLTPIFNAAKNGQPIPTPTADPGTPPAVGSYPGKILIDPTQPIYAADGQPNWSNITPAYSTIINKSAKSFGQCAWYAAGRFYETTSINTVPMIAAIQQNRTVPEINDVTVITDINKLPSKGIVMITQCPFGGGGPSQSPPTDNSYQQN